MQESEKETSKSSNEGNYLEIVYPIFEKNEDGRVIPENQKIDSSNVCNYILEDRHPLDWKEEKLESKTEELKKQLQENKRLAEERLNQLRYFQADFDNYRKKFDKEKEQIIKLANENLIKELIIILDDFDAAIKLSAEEENKKGLLTLKKKFFDILVNQGLKEIEALGRKFNPEFHEVLCKELSKHNEDKIIEEIQKGYLLREKVIRASKVKVAKNDVKKSLKMEDEIEKNKEKDKI